MDRTLHTDSFERLLKEKSDEFRMYPTKKIWRSIYNNIYPGRRWPSAVIGITLLAMLPLIGFLNTKTHSLIAEKNTIVNNIVTVKTSSLLTTKFIKSANTFYTDPRKYFSTKAFIAITNKKFEDQNHEASLSSDFKLTRPTITTLVDKKDISLADNTSNINSLSDDVSEKNTEADVKNNAFEKDMIAENYALQNNQPAQKLSDKLALQVYASPSVIYGIVSNIPINPSSFSGEDANNLNSSLGLEAGTSMQYKLSDIIKVKAGLQFNYASYDVSAYQNATVAAPLFPNDPNVLNSYDMLLRSSDNTNLNGNIPLTLHNEMYQFSLPVGMELKLLKHKNLQWNAGATIQPTYIAGGNAYLLSSDNHTYIDESSLINKWNLNAGFETFITYKIDGVTWQLGPQFRYQFSSTYNKAYSPIDEKVAVFGVKIGVIKELH